ncbi:MAG TPA: endonuclease MutS2 [Pyrinomonadaceae bacterium]|jgi:DNA mismatch repair protein MutS2|nr:endonuclease MutS2 [Pyrinomonadaceae bacterium]
MNSSTFSALEYGTLRQRLARYAQTPMGRARMEDLAPLSDRRALQMQLDALSEALYLLENDKTWRFTELPDLENAIALLSIKGTNLEPLVIVSLARLCEQAFAARAVISENRDDCPVLWQIVHNLSPELQKTLSRITRKILPNGELDDSASPALAKLRSDINSQRARLTKSLEALMRKADDAVQDDLITVRNDRFVIPVKADFRGKIAGVAHGFSSSGATVFVEPLESIEANNELQMLRDKEQNEIVKILFELTEELRAELPAIENAFESVAELDFIRAKLEFARGFEAVVPKISNGNTLEFIDARHPLLEENLRRQSTRSEPGAVATGSKSSPPFEGGVASLERDGVVTSGTNKIVPSSFTLTDEHSAMIISGANAGGKTVVLKTAGLLSLMAISGLPVPAKSAEVPFYQTVLADIGDHQSLAANLSTFSSHMTNIAEMLRICKAPSLVLLDEVGTGTDPEEGSALGVAIVEEFRRCGAHLIASTHYRGLKSYAASDESVVNASVEFDEKTLQPTYRLLTGMAGVSSGIEIARRFGIPDKVIDSARENLDEAAQEAEKYLLNLKRESDSARDLRVALEEEREAVAQKFAGLEVQAGRREMERRKQSEKELAAVVANFERQANALLETIEDKQLRQKLQKDVAAKKASLKRSITTSISGETAETRAAGSVSNIQIKDAPITIGTKVLTSLGSIGTVEKIDGNTAEILSGSMRLREKLKDLKVVADQAAAVGSAAAAGSKKLENLQKKIGETRLDFDDESRGAELNLIGKTVAVAEDDLDRFLDESYLAGFPKVRIIHGIGTGALRSAVRGMLQGHPHVDRYTTAPQNQGGEGATIVELKQ